MMKAKPLLRIRTAWMLCLCTALWFALGSTIKVLAASSSGKTIEMVICNGAGMKKIQVPVSSSAGQSSEVHLKHCSNTPLAILPQSFNALEHLAYAAPNTHASWSWLGDAGIERDWLRNGKPPPGRAPPLFSLA